MREVFARLEAQGYPRDRQEVSDPYLRCCHDLALLTLWYQLHPEVHCEHAAVLAQCTHLYCLLTGPSGKRRLEHARLLCCAVMLCRAALAAALGLPAVQGP